MDLLQRTALCTLLLQLVRSDHHCQNWLRKSHLSSKLTSECHSSVNVTGNATLFSHRPGPFKDVIVYYCRNGSESTSHAVVFNISHREYFEKIKGITYSDYYPIANLSIKHVTNEDAGTYVWFIHTVNDHGYVHSLLDVECETPPPNALPTQARLVTNSEHRMIPYHLLLVGVLAIGVILYLIRRYRNSRLGAQGQISESPPVYMIERQGLRESEA
ncbi:uncharacterized protein LOC115473298 [Microcaecilia unicolor]|uniref:Uncharacterized protein LOC115473298 n=1 Tax=Microcaecilia unicolor TaxID=1415580 RepID=A0A6P7Y937_9AMPH|nr:uncharacterized protein LOC115473298 [Microcaecilia unicolor]